jgi:hypothetical protein
VLALGLLDGVVGERGAVAHRAVAPRGAGRERERVDEGGLAAGPVPDHGHVADLAALVLAHVLTASLEVAVVRNAKRAVPTGTARCERGERPRGWGPRGAQRDPPAARGARSLAVAAFGLVVAEAPAGDARRPRRAAV